MKNEFHAKNSQKFVNSLNKILNFN